MRAMRAEQFTGYEAFRLVELPRPTVADGKVLVRITAAGVTPLDYTILSGNFHIPEVPLVLGNEGAGVVEEGGGADFPAGSRVMFWGVYGAFEDGTYREWIAVRKEDLCLIWLRLSGLFSCCLERHQRSHIGSRRSPAAVCKNRRQS
jgi:NADPH:quinone reductase